MTKFVRGLVLTASFIALSRGAVASDDMWGKWLRSGDTDREEQKLAQAEHCYRQAVHALEKNKHTDEELVTCYGKLADTLTLEDKTEEAVTLYKKSLHILESNYGRDSAQVVPTLFSLGSIYEAAGDHQPAMDLYNRALAITQKSYGPTSPAVAKSLHRLGRTKLALGQANEAEHDYRESLAILTQDPGLKASDELESLLSDYQDLLRKKESIDTTLISDYQKDLQSKRTAVSNSVNTLAQSSFQQQFSAHVEKQADDTNEQQQVLLRGYKAPLSNSALAPAYSNMSDTLLNQKSFSEQEKNFERMIAIDIKSLGPNHPSVGDDLLGLANLYMSEKRYVDAKPLLARALAIYEPIYGEQNLLVTNTRARLAKACRDLGETQEASDIYGNIFSTAKMALSPNTLETSRLLNDLGDLYYRQGKLQEAATIYQWALASTEAAAGKESPLVAACLDDYANILSSLGRTSEAKIMQTRAMLILAKASNTK